MTGCVTPHSRAKVRSSMPRFKRSARRLIGGLLSFVWGTVPHSRRTVPCVSRGKAPRLWSVRYLTKGRLRSADNGSIMRHDPTRSERVPVLMAKPPPDPDLARRVRAAIAYGPYKKQGPIAEALGITEDQLRRYLRAELAFTEAQLRKIAEMCDVSLRLLYEEFPRYVPSGELPHAGPDSPATDPRRDQ